MSSELNYISYGKKIDGTNYCAGLETFADNIIEENEDDAVVVYPDENAWTTPRNDEEYRLTTDNVKIILPYNIYKVVRLFFEVPALSIGAFGLNAVWESDEGKQYTNSSLSMSMLYKADGKTLWDGAADITSRLKTKEEFLALPAVKKSDANKTDEDNRHNTLYYTIGDNKIVLGESAKGVLGGVTGSFYYVVEMWKKSIPSDWMAGELGIYVDERNGTVQYDGSGANTVFYKLKKVNGIDGKVSDSSVREQRFRVEFIPLRTKEKLRARKNASTTVDFFQPYNQRAELVNAAAFGKNMAITAQKTGIQELTVVKRYTKLADIPPVGARVTHNGRTYRIASNSYSITNTTYIQVTHSLSENWTMKSNHVAVDQKFRNWDIPLDIVERTLYHEEFLHISTEEIAGTNLKTLPFFMDIFKSDASSDKPVTQMFLTPSGVNLHDSYFRVVSPCVSYGTAQSIVISAGFTDNLFCGVRVIDSDENKFCEPVQYCYEDGSLPRASITLSNKLNNPDDPKWVDFYPASNSKYNKPDEEIFYGHFEVLKDKGEAIKFTYQMHLIADKNDIIIGAKFAELSTLIKKWTSRTIKVVRLKRKLLNGEEKLKESECFNAGNVTVDRSNGTVGAGLTQPSYSAWAIVDNDYNLLVGCNDVNKALLYFAITNNK